MPDPSIWDKPYFSNSAFTVRGWRDIAAVWRALPITGAKAMASDWLRRSDQLQAQLIKSIDANTRTDKQPPYIGPLPGTTQTFREDVYKRQTLHSAATQPPAPQQDEL